MKNNTDEVNLLYLDHKSVKWVHLIFQTLIILTMVGSVISIIKATNEIENQISHLILSTSALVLFNVPNFLKIKYKLYIPSVLQVVSLIFIYSHFILGEIFRLYDYSILFDKVLHTTSGIAITILGFSLINFLNQSKNLYLKLSPFFVAFFSFCFSLTIAALWELFEFGVDSIFNSNMQRWKVSVTELSNATLDLGRVGLIDSMLDIIVCMLGSLLVSTIGYFSLKTKKNILNRVMFHRIVDYDLAIEDAIESGDYKLVEAIKKARIMQTSNKFSNKNK